MPNKLTDNEIVKALECCAYLEACAKCPMANLQKYDTDTCEHQIMLYSFDFINRQKEEIERLNTKIKSIYKELERISLMTVETDRKELVGKNDV